MGPRPRPDFTGALHAFTHGPPARPKKAMRPAARTAVQSLNGSRPAAAVLLRVRESAHPRAVEGMRLKGKASFPRPHGKPRPRRLSGPAHTAPPKARPCAGHRVFRFSSRAAAPVRPLPLFKRPQLCLIPLYKPAEAGAPARRHRMALCLQPPPLGLNPAGVFGVQLSARFQGAPIGRLIRPALKARPRRNGHKNARGDGVCKIGACTAGSMALKSFLSSFAIKRPPPCLSAGRAGPAFTPHAGKSCSAPYFSAFYMWMQ